MQENMLERGKGAHIPWDSERIFCALLPPPANTLLVEAYKTILDVIKICDHDIQVDVEELSNGTGQEHLYNAGIFYRIAFRYPGN